MCVCVRACVYISDIVKTVLELSLLPNNTAKHFFYTNQEQCDVLGRDLAVTGRIRDIAQNVLQSSF